MDLAWLTAQVDADEAAARAVLSACRDTRDAWPPEQEAGRGGPVLTAYLRRFNEGRALREVAFKRELIEEAESQFGRELPEGVNDGRDPDERERDEALKLLLDDLLRSLAVVYQDRPGYKDAVR